MIYLPKQPKVTREEARRAVRKSLDETIALHKSFRDGTWKPKKIVDIVERGCGK